MTPEDIAQINPGYWAQTYKVKLQSGIFSFKNHEYQVEPMAETPRRVCYMKATQGGWTEIEVLKSLHGMINKKYPAGVLYLFPTTDDVLEFSKSRFNPLIANNKQLIGKYIKNVSGPKGTDSASLKKVHDAYLYLRGAKLNMVLPSGKKESSKLRGIPVDRFVADEIDMMDEESYAKAAGRMRHSEVQEECYISNPTTPGFGIAKVFDGSDQRHWFRKCVCGHWTCAELSFPGCVLEHKGGEHRHKGYIACDKCKKEIGISPGEWVAQYPSNTEMRGYQHSQLTTIYNDPWEILSEYNDPPHNNLADVVSLRLGMPYANAEDMLLDTDVYNCCGNDLPFAAHKGPCAMGVDIGKTFHVVIGAKTGQDQYQIFSTAQIKEDRLDQNWVKVHELAKRFNVRSAVIDSRPYESDAVRFQNEEPYRIYLCEYKENQITQPNFSLNTGVVQVGRTWILDETHNLTVTPGRLKIPRVCPQTKVFAHQMTQTAKQRIIDKVSGESKYRYVKTGDKQDHFRHALNYFSLACMGNKVARIGADMNRQKVASNFYQVA